VVPHLVLDALAALAPCAVAACAAESVRLRRRLRRAAGQAAALQRRLTALELDRADLERTSVTDPLTGVWNYRYLQLALGREVARALRAGRPFSLLLVSLEGFDAVKQERGRPAAGALLREYAQRLSDEVRGTDTLGLYGGEEFLVLLPDADAAGAEQVAERLRWAVRRHRPPLDPGDCAGRIGAAVGVAVLPDHGSHPSTLLRAAGRALAADRAGERVGERSGQRAGELAVTRGERVREAGGEPGGELSTAGAA